jgi:eukaryotic-like serine/threonine-protein kinase
MAFPPRRFGRYYLFDKLAVGGMAEVFKAKLVSEHGFEMLLVIKRILPHLSANGEFVQMFVDEAKITVGLRHQNIVQTYDFGLVEENYFIAMECVEGRDLKTLLKTLESRGKFLSTGLAVYIAHEVCKGLDYAHKKRDNAGAPMGIVHRDITPANILVSYTGEVKVADFGIAKARNKTFTTKDGVLKGKYEYMSPEQAQGLATSNRSDVFGVGILLHEMLTGRRLFHEDTELASLEKVKACEIPEPAGLNPSLSEGLSGIAMRALSKDPSDRFEDCKMMQKHLSESLSPINPTAAADLLARLMQELYSSDILEEREESRQSYDAIQEMLEPEELLELDEVWELGAEPPRTWSRLLVGLICICAMLLSVIVLLLFRILQH